MKKYLLLIVLFLTSASGFAGLPAEEKEPTKSEMKAKLNRVFEIIHMDKSGLSELEKQNLRKELFQMKAASENTRNETRAGLKALLLIAVIIFAITLLPKAV